MLVKLLLGLIVLPAMTLGQTSALNAKAARDHMGEIATVCGTVVSSRSTFGALGQTIHFDFDQPYPNTDFSAIIVGAWHVAKFANPGYAWRGKYICIAGQIRSVGGTPSIVLNSTEQIRATEPEQAHW